MSSNSTSVRPVLAICSQTVRVYVQYLLSVPEQYKHTSSTCSMSANRTSIRPVLALSSQTVRVYVQYLLSVPEEYKYMSNTCSLSANNTSIRPALALRSRLFSEYAHRPCLMLTRCPKVPTAFYVVPIFVHSIRKLYKYAQYLPTVPESSPRIPDKCSVLS